MNTALVGCMNGESRAFRSSKRLGPTSHMRCQAHMHCSNCVVFRNESHYQKARMKISKFTKFGYVSLHINQAVSRQMSLGRDVPQIHTQSIFFSDV